jgi:LPS sulfotransferase NodH
MTTPPTTAARQPDRTHYVILFQGRAGSSFLVDALGRLPGVVAEGEMLVGLDPARGSFANRLRRLFRPGPDDGPAQFQTDTTRHFYAAAWPGARAIGFKTKVRDVYDLEAFARVLTACDVRAIALDRRNAVKQAVSNLNADRLHQALGEWNLPDGKARLGPFTAEPADFDDALRRVVFAQEMLDVFVRHLRVPVLRLEYEDLLREPAGWFGSVCRFIGVPPAEPRSAVAKNTDDDLRSVLLNFDELKARYDGTPYAAMFDDRVARERAS